MSNWMIYDPHTRREIVIGDIWKLTDGTLGHITGFLSPGYTSSPSGKIMFRPTNGNKGQAIAPEVLQLVIQRKDRK